MMEGQEKGAVMPVNEKRAFSVPASTYRLQFNSKFTFEAASAILPYLKALGIESLYSSPYFQAIPGSMHGYNITNPNKMNDEIGGEWGFGRFCEALEQNGMKQILDIVPNHMGILSSYNLWWTDVLENGPASIYAHFFDIEWNPVKSELMHKVLLPILGNFYGTVLENQEIRLIYNDGRFYIHYFDHELPIAPETYPLILEPGMEALVKEIGEDDPLYQEYLSVITSFRRLPERTILDPKLKADRNREKEIAKRRLAAITLQSDRFRNFIETRVEFMNGRKGESHSFDQIDQLLNQQSYRLSFWRVASEEINYRRFFDINELAAIRMEDPRVFQLYHERIFQLLHEKKVQGLRIDHPDGLYDPAEYFNRLQARYAADLKDAGEELDAAQKAPLYLIVEKILDRKESLPEDWNIHGTVGYDYLNLLNGLFIKKENEEELNKIYEGFIKQPADFRELTYEKKKLFSLIHMAGEINALGHLLDQISERQRHYRDYTRNNLTLAIREVISCFPVYRTYISPNSQTVTERDRKYITIAIERAKTRTPLLSKAVYDFLKKVLLLEWDVSLEWEDRRLYQDFVLRFQQLSAPIMAKGLEDTSFYIYNRLLSLNEVGADPSRFGVSIEEFHSQNLERNKNWPFSFLATSTHDSKRSEDIRFRMDVLSELTAEWKDRLDKWAFLNAKHKSPEGENAQPEANLEYFIYQNLVGVWPDEPITDPEAFRQRLWNYFLKSIREAKDQTSWTDSNAEYEERVKKFVLSILNFEEANPFLDNFLVFQKKVAHYGFWNSLSAMVLKAGSPGVLDTYQGCELWNYALVDPDNRQPVDYKARIECLESLKRDKRPTGEQLRDLIRERRSGKIKLYLLWKALHLRREYPELFLGGDYRPLKTEGERSSHLVAYAREKDGKVALIAAGRFFTELLANEEELPVGEPVWKDTVILLPEAWKDLQLTDIYSGKVCTPFMSGGSCVLKAADLFSEMAAGVWVSG